MSVFPANHVWATAAAAYRINGNQFVSRRDASVLCKVSNTSIIESLLEQTDRLTEQDFAFGEKIRTHYQSLLLRFMEDGLVNFLRDAHLLSNREQFEFGDTHDSRKAMNLLACLPHTYQQELKRAAERELLAEKIAKSTPQVPPDGCADCRNSNFPNYNWFCKKCWIEKLPVTVVDCVYKPAYETYATNVEDEKGNIYFFFGFVVPFTVGEKLLMTGHLVGSYSGATKCKRVLIERVPDVIQRGDIQTEQCRSSLSNERPAA
jgi:hypothetical protein